MKKVLTVFCILLCSVFSLSSQTSGDYYCAGQKFIGGNLGFGKVDDSSFSLIGFSYGKAMTHRLTYGVGAYLALADIDSSTPAFEVTPFARYNLLTDGPVAVFAQANITIAMVFPEDETGGIIWPHLSAGLSYRLSDHFTAFAQMGIMHLFAIPFGSMFSDGDSGSDDDYPFYYDDEDEDEPSSSSLPILFGFTNHPSIGIHYTF